MQSLTLQLLNGPGPFNNCRVKDCIRKTQCDIHKGAGLLSLLSAVLKQKNIEDVDFLKEFRY